MCAPVCVNQQPVCVCSILHPALIPQGLGPSLICWRLIRGQLIRDTRAIVLTLTVGHWNANREHTKPNGVEEQQIFGQDPFFTDGADRFMVSETRLEQMAVWAYWAFIWTVFKSTKTNTTTCRYRKGCTRAAPPSPLINKKKVGEGTSWDKTIPL